MPKAIDKNKSSKKRHSDASDSNNNNSQDKGSKRKKSDILDDKDSISKSKKLLLKLKEQPTKRSRTIKSSTPKICGNGKPMPPLSELEKMFEDSDSDEQSSNPSKCNTSVKSTSSNIDLSPTTIKKNSSHVMDRFAEVTDPTEFLEYLPTLPLIPQKKTQKSDTPYIVGCKDIPQIIKKSNTNICKGGDYGLYLNAAYDEEIKNSSPRKYRKRRYKKVNLSKSIFNAQSDDIASKLQQNELDLCDSSSDSSKTVEYEYTSKSPTSSRLQTFSPLPSTSRDNQTFIKNDELFIKSQSENDQEIVEVSSSNDIEVIENPVETIVIEDSIQKLSFTPVTTVSTADEKSVEITEATKENNEIIDVDEYSSINLDLIYDNSVIEVIDVDDIIQESKSVTGKYNNKLNTLSSVESVTNITNYEANTVENNNGSQQSLISVMKQVVNNFFKNIGKMDFINLINQPPIKINDLKEKEILNDFISANKHNVKRIVGYSQKGTYSSTDFNRNNKSSHINAHTVCTQIVHISPEQSNCETMAQHTVSSLQPYPERDIPNPQKNISIQHKSAQLVQTSPVQNGKSYSLGDCPICMDCLSSNQVASTLCGHVFCLKCIKAAIKASGKRCPTCRKGLRGAGYHQLFL